MGKRDIQVDFEEQNGGDKSDQICVDHTHIMLLCFELKDSI